MGDHYLWILNADGILFHVKIKKVIGPITKCSENFVASSQDQGFPLEVHRCAHPNCVKQVECLLAASLLSEPSLMVHRMIP